QGVNKKLKPLFKKENRQLISLNHKSWALCFKSPCNHSLFSPIKKLPIQSIELSTQPAVPRMLELVLKNSKPECQNTNLNLNIKYPVIPLCSTTILRAMNPINDNVEIL